MFSTDRILALDVGASKIRLAEFTIKGPVPVLTGYASASSTRSPRRSPARTSFPPSPRR